MPKKESSFQEHSGNEKEETSISTFNLDQITSDDEIYTLQMPNYLNKKDLVGKNLNSLIMNCNTDSESHDKFSVELLQTKKNICVGFPQESNNSSLLNVPIKGHILIKKDVGNFDAQKYSSRKDIENKISLPKDLVCRHPLLGLNWKTHLKESTFFIADYVLCPLQLVIKLEKNSRKLMILFFNT
ncbi:hypothetical protein Phum_PHUM047540 [Pediculus humanus corporis]|uniref:Uncharacterized protein n=1 Tax=Pediculus humanus subsp. corporis TaxID=121224 RepID=E0VAZ8_PEDHC|nr:uncharacterized protein Phum_PHUM047540 [Pediculus humanus corporis]EEB10554.1 hypothetical protein Phum_PHUM047540 [Pediculus humanus corporis]